MAAEKEPKIQEIDSDDDSEEEPELAEIGAGGASSSSGAGVTAGGDKQNRGEKKSRKAVAKLGLKHIGPVSRITVKKTKSVLFVIQKPDVYKAPNSDIYVVFGEAKVDDQQQKMMQAQLAQMAEQMKLGEGKEAMGSIKEETEDEKEAAAAAVAAKKEAEMEERDIELVIAQGKCTREEAIEALKATNFDIVEAILKVST